MPTLGNICNISALWILSSSCLASKASVAQLRATASASASPEPLGAILCYPVCVHLTISRTVRASCTAHCPSPHPHPHPGSAVCSVQQSGWVRIIKNKLTCVPIISTALAAGSLLAVSFAVPHSASLPLSHCPSVLPLSSPGSLSVVVVADMCFLWTTTKTEIDVRIAYKNKE